MQDIASKNYGNPMVFNSVPQVNDSYTKLEMSGNRIWCEARLAGRFKLMDTGGVSLDIRCPSTIYTDDFVEDVYKRQGQPATDYNRNQDQLAIIMINRWYDYWRERPGTGNRVSSGGTKIVFSDTNTHHRGEENYRRSGVTERCIRDSRRGTFQ